eukprot:12423220-Karenia_brevis.AAC.1
MGLDENASCRSSATFTAISAGDVTKFLSCDPCPEMITLITDRESVRIQSLALRANTTLRLLDVR